jgi:NAD(P)-dependent dehydrogenase (short-subunit alcohol dehydrogenase family)
MHMRAKQIVVITGASRGIGEETAYCFARQGNTLVLTYNTACDNAATVGACCLRIGASGVQTIQLDIRDNDSRQNFVRQLAASVPHVDTLINNAGVLVANPLQLQSEAEIDWQIETNLSGPIKLIRALLPYGLKRVINVAGDLGKRGVADFSVYCASKFGLRGFTQALALEGTVEVICVNPDKTGTAMNDGQGRKPAVPADVIYRAALGKYPVANGGDADVRELAGQ